MKRYFKYGLIIISVLAVIALVFYLLNKPKSTVLTKIPSDVTYCFTIDKTQVFKESDFLENAQKDAFFIKLKNKLPKNALKIYHAIGLNSLGDLAIFGEKNEDLNIAWIGKNEEVIAQLIKKNKWHETKFKNFNQVKISDQLYLNYKWPYLVLNSALVNENFDFFNPTIKKLTAIDMHHPKLNGCLIYGFIIIDRNFIINYPYIPLYGKAFAGVKKSATKTELYFIQRRMKLLGKLGLPKHKPKNIAVLSWPIDSQPVSKIKFIPNLAMDSINRIINKSVVHLYAEVLDTLSTYQEIVRYNLDAEFQLTQKIIHQYQTFPGMRLEFVKKVKDEVNRDRPISLGLDIFKLTLNEINTSYIIASEHSTPLLSNQALPDYYIYANLDRLKADPFWDTWIKTNYETLELHAENLGKGSIFILTLE